MLKLTLDDMKVQFLQTVHESIINQIKQTDIKMSILLTWNGVIAAVYGKYLGDMISTRIGEWWIWFLAALILIAMVVTSIMVYAVLRPRGGKKPEVEGFSGLLYAGDIQMLGKLHEEKVEQYMKALIELKDYEAIYEQFSRSIVNIAEIHVRKNYFFVRALASTLISFVLLVVLMAILGGILSIDKAGMPRLPSITG